MEIKLILNVWCAMLIYNLVFASIGQVVLKYFLDNSKVVQESKKTFRDKLNDKLKENNETPKH